MRYFPIYKIELMGVGTEATQRIQAMIPLLIRQDGYTNMAAAEKATREAAEKIASILAEAGIGNSLKLHVAGVEILFGQPIKQEPPQPEEQPAHEPTPAPAHKRARRGRQTATTTQKTEATGESGKDRE